jgi:hypothetical protein
MMREMRNVLFLLAFNLILAPIAASQPAPGPKEPAYQNEPPADIPPPLLELKAEKERLDTSLEKARGKLGPPPHRPHRMGPRPMMGDPLKRPIDADRLRQSHKIFREFDHLRRERDRVVEDAWETFDRLCEGDLPEFPSPSPEAAKKLERWMMTSFGPRPRGDPFHSMKGPPWQETLKDNIGKRIELLLLRLQRMEERITELEETVTRQREEIGRLRDAVRRCEESQSDRTEE